MSTTRHDPTRRHRRARVALVLAGALAATVLAACGGGSDSSSETAAATTAEAAAAVPADEWAASVCTAVGDWQTELQSSAPDAGNLTDIESAKQTLGDFLDGASTATDEMVSEVEAAGVPDVENGEEIAQKFQANLAAVGDSFDQAKTDLDALSTDDPTGFAAGLQGIATTLTTAGTEAGQAFDKLAAEYPSAGIDDAAAEVPECAALG